jgi:hypothetical protein
MHFDYKLFNIVSELLTNLEAAQMTLTNVNGDLTLLVQAAN